MKSLIVVFTFCPDTERKLILLNLLQKLQTKRNEYDILVVSHSSLPDTVNDLTDYSFVESDNHLWTDFDLRNRFWFKTNIFFAHSTLIYPFSTHHAIYSLIHYTLNFARFKKYKKVHCIEYDINFSDTNLIDQVDSKLDEYNNIMFKSENGWIHGIYFALDLENLPEEYFHYDDDFIKKEIRGIDTRMTEHYTPVFLSVNERSTYYENMDLINSDKIYQLKDSHGNDEFNWCVPVVEKETDDLHLVVFNEKNGDHHVSVIVNDKSLIFDSGPVYTWKFLHLGKFSQIENLTILVDGQIKHNILFDDNNRQSFIKNNYLNRT